MRASYTPAVRSALVKAMRALPAPLDMRLHGVVRRILARRPEYVCQTESGAVMICSTADFLESRILHFGIWEPDVTAVLNALLQPGAGMIDIGANVGYDTLLAAPIAKFVFAIEPGPTVLPKLRTNVEINHFDNVAIIEAAVSDRTGKIELYEGEAGNSGAMTTVASRGGALRAVVEMAPLHDLIPADKLSEVQLIKIDIEGAELPVLRSISANLDRYSRLDTIIAEISDGFAGAESVAALFPGFDPYILPMERLTAYLGKANGPTMKPLHDDGRKQFDIVLTKRAVPAALC